MKDKTIKVLVVDDSAFNRMTITDMLQSSPIVKVVGVALDGEDAIKKAINLKPDIITLDLEMPRMDGFTFLRIMASNFPTPTIVVSSRNDSHNVFKALELGAVDFIAKPTHQASSELLKIRDELLYKVGMAGQVSVDSIKTMQLPAAAQSPAKRAVPVTAKTEFPLVVIGASTGGPSAIQVVLSMLPSDIQFAVAISQHMPPGFTKTFAERLNKFSPFEVKEAENGDIVHPGRVLLSPGGLNMTFIKKGEAVEARLLPGEDRDRYVPSINRMFVSASELFGSRAVAVVMTGMGNDGKEGVVKIKSAGGKTIAQSEDTSVIFGMPREAIATGMVDVVLPLQGIAEGIVAMCR